MRRTALLLLFLTFCASLYAQEFRCSVSVNYQKLQQTTQPYPSDDKTVFDNMRQAIEDFVNSRKWTNLSFESNEYIDCSISLILNRRTTANDFEGRLSPTFITMLNSRQAKALPLRKSWKRSKRRCSSMWNSRANIATAAPVRAVCSLAKLKKSVTR